MTEVHKKDTEDGYLVKKWSHKHKTDHCCQTLSLIVVSAISGLRFAIRESDMMDAQTHAKLKIAPSDRPLLEDRASARWFRDIIHCVTVTPFAHRKTRSYELLTYLTLPLEQVVERTKTKGMKKWHCYFYN